jgi:hypothetical protein
MATRSRTYLPTDWQLWVYEPVAGKFRLDFSTLGGADVLGGATDLGTIELLDLRIGSIELDDGSRPDQSIFSSFAPGTMSISAQLLTWSETTVKELYNGKAIYLTLKNEATNLHPTFGKNSIYFMGVIDSLDIQVDPINDITNLNFTASDFSSTVLNLPLSFAKTNIGKDIDIMQAFIDAKAANLVNPYLTLSLSGMLSTYEATGTIVATVGELIQDFIASDVAIYTPYYYQNYSAGYTLGRAMAASTVATTVTDGELIPEAITSNISIGQDGGNVPQSFDLSNSTGNYKSGVSWASASSNPLVYTATIDVPTAHLQTIADKVITYTQKIQPVELTVRSAQPFQTIVFDNDEGDYIWPLYFWRNGQRVKTTPTYTGGTYYHVVVGTSHSITPDAWMTTYQLLKGL